MFFKSYYSNGQDVKKVASELVTNCYSNKSKIFMFFSSSKYDFLALSKEIKNLVGDNCKVIGTTTSGEISKKSGITKGGVSAISFGEESMKIESVVIKGISKIPLLYRRDIIKSLNNLGYKEEMKEYKDLSGILLVDGLRLAEEKVLSVINSIFDGNLQLIGGSAGDDLKFEETLLSIDGEILRDGAILTLVKSRVKMKLYRENIFESQGIEINITKADEKNRKIIEIDGQPARERYAKLLGINPNKLEKEVLKNPIGRVVGKDVFISSIASIEGNNLNMYAQVFENSKGEILKGINPVEAQKMTKKLIDEDFEKIYGMFCVNCILRSIQFEGEGNLKELSRGLESMGDYGGFVSYGEQYKKQHLNQTMTMLVMGR